MSLQLLWHMVVKWENKRTFDARSRTSDRAYTPKSAALWRQYSQDKPPDSAYSDTPHVSLAEALSYLVAPHGITLKVDFARMRLLTMQSAGAQPRTRSY
ncbi:hypothetical protein NLI96_g2300 [Meripilus lineatus]|uniref:Uncharacterized protein n=1 Tax=Meripilus lineatus TaxID=2056292 RepID=A0AAD5V8J9_9APHY|nr:hypothetical protein NLI96_g2300 [Physisporinus lineatus]